MNVVAANKQINAFAIKELKFYGSDPDALRTLPDRDLEEQLQIAAKLPAPDGPRQVEQVRLVQHQRKSRSHARVMNIQSTEEQRAWIPMWTREEMKTQQSVDDDLRVLYKALASPDVKCPEWKDITFEGLGCKYYHGEWSRLRMMSGTMYRRWEGADGVMVWYQLIIPRVYQRKIIEQVHRTSVGSH